jgi:arylsulfatase A-like enzyme
MPTLLELAGEAPPSPIDGRSVATELLAGREPDLQPVFAEISSNEAIYRGAQDPEQLAAHVMVYDGRWKYIRNRFDIDELYDLETDADEMHNLAAQPEHRERVSSMRRQIAEMVSHTGPGPYDWCLSNANFDGE